MKMVFILFYSVHFVGCIWFFIADMGDDERVSWVFRHNFIDYEPVQQYIISLYWSVQTVTTVGFGDVLPGQKIEFIIPLIWMPLGFFFQQ